MKKDWLTFMYQDKVFYPFLILQLLFICFFVDGLGSGNLGPIGTTICCMVFFFLLLFYAVSGRRILKMMNDLLREVEKK